MTAQLCVRETNVNIRRHIETKQKWYEHSVHRARERERDSWAKVVFVESVLCTHRAHSTHIEAKPVTEYI